MGVGDAVPVGEAVTVLIGVLVIVGVAVGVGVSVVVGVIVLVGVIVRVGVFVGVEVPVDDGVDVGVAGMVNSPMPVPQSYAVVAEAAYSPATQTFAGLAGSGAAPE